MQLLGNHRKIEFVTCIRHGLARALDGKGVRILITIIVSQGDGGNPRTAHSRGKRHGEGDATVGRYQVGEWWSEAKIAGVRADNLQIADSQRSYATVRDGEGAG